MGDTGPGETSGPGYTFVTMKKHQFVEKDLPKWNPEPQELSRRGKEIVDSEAEEECLSKGKE